MTHTFEHIMGEICKVLIPIPEEVYFGNKQSSIAICTLSSINLLKEIANSNLLDKVAIAGRLLSENKGIDAIIRYVNSNKNIKKIILCGKDVLGHQAGHSLIQLKKNGIDQNGRIINSKSPRPFLEVTQEEVEQFRKQITIIDRTGKTVLLEIKKLVAV